jgi:hypothetical protein
MPPERQAQRAIVMRGGLALRERRKRRCRVVSANPTEQTQSGTAASACHSATRRLPARLANALALANACHERHTAHKNEVTHDAQRLR